MAETRPRPLSKTLLLVLQECELESSARLDVVTVADPGSEHCLQFAADGLSALTQSCRTTLSSDL